MTSTVPLSPMMPAARANGIVRYASASAEYRSPPEITQMAKGMRRMRVHIESFGKPRISRPLGTSQFYLDISAIPRQRSRVRPAGPLSPHGRWWLYCGSFCGSPIPARHGCTESLLRGELQERELGLRILVLNEKIGPRQVTGSGKRLSPEGFVLGISGMEEIVVLDSVVAGGHSLHRPNR